MAWTSRPASSIASCRRPRHIPPHRSRRRVASLRRTTSCSRITTRMSLGLVVLGAASLAANGADAEAIIDKVEAIRPYVQTYFSVATLEFLRRGGRIGRASAMLGSVLQVKPVLCIRDGVVEPLERVRTFERALNRIIELAKAVDRGKGVCAVVGHADAEKDAQKVGKALEPIAETLMIQPLGPVVGAHGGPGVVGVGCYPADLLPLGIKTSRTGASAT
ncbi:MAG: DegV family EDD domain-containing protein [Chloroflexi bacterium]|nr:MAG: DegV family EDD domain-containing protein [Chloroflexota bacterium]